MANLKAVKRGNDYYCQCGEMLSVGGWGRRRIPLGFGFAGKGFQVDFIEIKTVMGYCFKCKSDGHFDLPSRKPKIVTRFPRKINNKLNAAILGGK